MNITRSQRTALQGAIAFLLLCVVLLQHWIDGPEMRRQPAIEPPKLINVAGTLGNTGAALPFEYTLGALTGFRQVIAGLLWVRSDAFFHEGNYDAILPLIRLITWLDPNWLDPYATGAWHLMYNFTDTDQRSDRRYLVPGMALLKEGIANNPTQYDMYKEAGWNSFDKIKNYQQAAEYYEEAEKNDPHYDVTQVGHALAHCYERMGMVDKAVAEWQKCVDKQKKIADDPKAASDDKIRNEQGYKTDLNNLKLLQERAKFRPKDSQPPVDADFHVTITRTKPKVIEVTGTWNLVGAKNFSDETGVLVQGPVDGARVEVRLQDAGYVMPEPKEFSFDVDENLTIMQEQISVHGGKQVKPGELYVAQTQPGGGSVTKNAEVVAIYGFGKDEDAGLGIPINQALAGGGVPLTPWGQLQAVSVAYPIPYASKDAAGNPRKQYTPAEVAPLFAKLKTDTAKIAELTKQGYCVATKGVLIPGKYKREIDMSKDPKMYGFHADKYDLIISFNPENTPDFVRDRIGWHGEGLTDKNFLDTTTVPGVRMIRKVFTVSRDDLLGAGNKVLATK